MSQPSILFGTLCLNEMAWLPKLYEQHREWPGMVRWVFVESADAAYAIMNPDRVSKDGLSVDGTTEFLESVAKEDDRITHVKLGISSHNGDKAQGKCASRNKYLEVADEELPDFVFVLDADEFYCRDDQPRINELMRYPSGPNHKTYHTAFCFGQRHVWRPPVIERLPLLSYEVRGGFWAIPHCRGWKHVTGMRYKRNHNTPETNRGVLLDGLMARLDQRTDTPRCVHTGFAAPLIDRAAKNRYYENRGESVDPKRKWYTESRAKFETWRPGDVLPNRAEVVPYDGPVPECFKRESTDV